MSEILQGPYPQLYYDKDHAVAYLQLTDHAYDHGRNPLHEVGIGGWDPNTGIDYAMTQVDYDQQDNPLGLEFLLMDNTDKRTSVEHYANFYGLDKTPGFDRPLRRQVRKLLHEAGIMVRDVPPPPTATYDIFTGQPYQRR